MEQNTFSCMYFMYIDYNTVRFLFHLATQVRTLYNVVIYKCILLGSLGAYIQKILLNYSMEDDSDEEIEEDGGTVLPSIMIRSHLSL